MIEIELRARTSHPYLVGENPQPEFLDYPERDSRAKRADTIVGVHRENLVAPIVAALDRRNALETYPELVKAQAEVLAAFADREDGLRLLDLLIPWCRRWPDGTWYVTGIERVPATRFIALPTEPRSIDRPLSIDPFARAVEWIGLADRMDGMDGIDLARYGDRDITVEQAMKRTKWNPNEPYSSGSSGAKKSKTGGAANYDGSEGWIPGQDDKKKRSSVVRLPAQVKAALALDPRAKTLFAALGNALVAGVPYETALTAIEQIVPEAPS